MDDILIFGSAFSIFSLVVILGLILTQDRYSSEKKDDDNIRMLRTQSLSILIDDNERDNSEYISEKPIQSLRKINEENHISKSWVKALINKRGGRECFSPYCNQKLGSYSNMIYMAYDGKYCSSACQTKAHKYIGPFW